MRKSCGLALLVLASAVAFADAPQSTVTFIGCPVYRDTDAGRKSGCWLAEDPATGIRYDVTDGPTKPQVGKLSLFEGVITQEPDTCGGVVLRPVRQAVLEGQRCPAAIIPPEEFPGRPFVLPADVLKPTWIPRELPQPPYSTQQFHIVFDYGNDFVIYQYAELILEKVSLLVKAAQPQAVVITAYAATEPYEVSGQTLREPASLAKARADMVAEALYRLGVDRQLMKLETDLQPEVLTGLGAPTPTPETSKRRVTIEVRM